MKTMVGGRRWRQRTDALPDLRSHLLQPDDRESGQASQVIEGTDRLEFSSSSYEPRDGRSPDEPAIRSAIAPRERRASRSRLSSISRLVMSLALKREAVRR